MSYGDIAGLVLSYVYAFALLFGMEALGRWRHWPQDLTRKLTHIGAGMWVWGELWLFDHWYWGLIPFGTFIVFNYLFWRGQVFKAMDTRESSPGTVYFAISITLLFALLWRTDGPDWSPIAVAAVMAMTWGDALASLVGVRWGRHLYRTFGHQRSWEGSVAMWLCAALGILLTLRLLPGSALSPHSVPFGWGATLLATLVGASVATVAEGLSPAGSDNLSVPLLSGLALWLLLAS